MPRYIDADALIRETQRVFCEGCNNYNGIRCRACGTDDAISMLDNAPTVDVVPKSEVAREIFEEIEKLVALKMPAKITPIFKRDLDYSHGVIDGQRDAVFGILVLLAELKKKYIVG